jgi:hypothetical protein
MKGCSLSGGLRRAPRSNISERLHGCASNPPYGTKTKQMTQNTAKNINGQWFGKYNGSSSGMINIDLDNMGTCFKGHGFIKDYDEKIQDIFLEIEIDSSNNTSASSYEIDPDDKINWKTKKVALCKVDLVYDILKIDLNINNKTVSAEIERSKADKPSEYQSLNNITNWKSFKEYINDIGHQCYIFRGQSEKKRLRTSFHRTGRSDLRRYYHEDIKTLHRQLSQRTSHYFNLSNHEERGAFFNLAQHHDFPTPLLDWTFSPYVAAFFAYRRLKKSDVINAKPEEKVRIFILNKEKWKENVKEIPTFEFARPYFSIYEFPSINNERLVPQQSVSSLTSVDDIETYIREKEIITKHTYLQVIDLPSNERQKVMKELSVMGVNAGSLFPGIEGTCEALRERFF